MRKLLYIFILFFPLIAYSQQSFSSDERVESPSKKIEHFLSALRSYNYSKAYFLYTSSSFKKTTSLQQFLSFIHANPVLAHNKDIRFYRPFFYEGSAIIRASITSSQGDKRVVEFYLRREKNIWKIASIKIIAPEEK